MKVQHTLQPRGPHAARAQAGGGSAGVGAGQRRRQAAAVVAQPQPARVGVQPAVHAGGPAVAQSLAGVFQRGGEIEAGVVPGMALHVHKARLHGRLVLDDQHMQRGG